jgi:hypothetical protein
MEIYDTPLKAYRQRNWLFSKTLLEMMVGKELINSGSEHSLV